MIWNPVSSSGEVCEGTFMADQMTIREKTALREHKTFKEQDPLKEGDSPLQLVYGPASDPNV